MLIPADVKVGGMGGETNQVFQTWLEKPCALTVIWEQVHPRSPPFEDNGLSNSPYSKDQYLSYTIDLQLASARLSMGMMSMLNIQSKEAHVRAEIQV